MNNYWNYLNNNNNAYGYGTDSSNISPPESSNARSTTCCSYTFLIAMTFFISDIFFIASLFAAAVFVTLAAPGLTDITRIRIHSTNSGPGYRILNKTCSYDDSDKLLPECTSDSYRRNQEATCSPLNSMSRAATCSRFGSRVSCQSQILPFTKARITCRINYGVDPTFSSSAAEQEVECNPNGQWSPEPITCSPVCGAVYHSKSNEDLEVLPWHANIWEEIPTPQGSVTQYQCSATIVETNLVITTAHCVTGGAAGTTKDPRRLRVTVGNAHGEQNSGSNPASALRKVKNVHMYCEDARQIHGYTSDIALVELSDPFEFSTAVLPACLDVSIHREQDFSPGTSGRVDGYCKRSPSNHIYRIVEATLISTSECRMPNSGDAVAIRSDQFCAVYSKKSTGCRWKSGGGFVAIKGGLWHLMGIFIGDLGLQGTETSCIETPYSLYTKVSSYMAWVQDVIFQLARYKGYPPCKFQSPPLFLTPTARRRANQSPRWSTTSDSVYNRRSTSCSAPPQPANGKWRLDTDLCNNQSCDVPRNTQLQPGTLLIYSCASGFRLHGRSDVYCTALGRWSNIPICV